MDARIAGQIRGIENSVPRRGTTPAGADARPTAPTKPAPGQSAPAAAQHELFDANSDGVIESWSYAHGGDSYETFNPPPSGQIGSNARRTSRTQPDAIANDRCGRGAGKHRGRDAQGARRVPPRRPGQHSRSELRARELRPGGRPARSRVCAPSDTAAAPHRRTICPFVNRLEKRVQCGRSRF